MEVDGEIIGAAALWHSRVPASQLPSLRYSGFRDIWAKEA